MADLDRVPWIAGPRPDGRAGRAPLTEATLERRIREMEDSVVALRREAVVAVMRQEQIESRLAPVQERAGRIEWAATLALERGDDHLARQMLYRELKALALRDSLRQELLAARRHTIGLLRDAARLEDRARLARRAADENPRHPTGSRRPTGLEDRAKHGASGAGRPNRS